MRLLAVVAAAPMVALAVWLAVVTRRLRWSEQHVRELQDLNVQRLREQTMHRWKYLGTDRKQGWG